MPVKKSLVKPWTFRYGTRTLCWNFGIHDMVRGNISVSEDDIARQKHGSIAQYSHQDADFDMFGVQSA